MMTKNPYDVLGVSPNASDDEIKRAYRDLTRKYHPDANVNNPLADLAEEKFKEVQEAYDIIMRERANGGIGNQILARDHAAQAVNMEPNNMQFRQLLNQLDFNSRRYQNSPYGGGYAPGGQNSCGTGNMCCDLWLADTLCECMGGDLCSCM